MENSTSKYAWVYFAVFWSLFMILLMGVGEPLYKEEEITVKSVLHEVMVWISAGILVGLWQRYSAKRAAKKKAQ